MHEKYTELKEVLRKRDAGGGTHSIINHDKTSDHGKLVVLCRAWVRMHKA